MSPTSVSTSRSARSEMERGDPHRGACSPRSWNGSSTSPRTPYFPQLEQERPEAGLHADGSDRPPVRARRQELQAAARCTTRTRSAATSTSGTSISGSSSTCTRSGSIRARCCPATTRALSFAVEPLWKLARGEAQAGPDIEAFAALLLLFSRTRRGALARENRVRSVEPRRGRSAAQERRATRRHRPPGCAVAPALPPTRRGRQQSARYRSLPTSKLNPGFEERLLGRVGGDRPGPRARHPNEDALPDAVNGYRSGGEFEQRVWRQYSLRVAQLTLARILLYRAWEDVGFIREQLYDGGFRATFTRRREKRCARFYRAPSPPGPSATTGCSSARRQLRLVRAARRAACRRPLLAHPVSPRSTRRRCSRRALRVLRG